MMKPVIILSASAIALAIFVPGIAPKNAKQIEHASISREAESVVSQTERRQERERKQATRTETKAKATRQRAICFQDADSGLTVCPRRGLTKPAKVKKEPAKKVAKAKSKTNNKNRGRSYEIERDAQGHFKTTARMNGVRVPILVDTGATSVAINRSTARRLGLNPRKKDFIHKASTANGTTNYAKVKIRNVRIGGIVFDDVDAFVLEDKALKTTLLGMSFLNRLTKFQMENGKFKMLQ